MNKRNVKGNKIQDAAIIANAQYNESSGAQKQMEVGPKLVPLTTVVIGVETKTTDASTLIALPSMGRSLAVYNNANTLGSITFGVAGQVSKTAGAVDSSTGAVGIPCKPNDWTYLSSGDATHVITSASTLLVFLIEDDSQLVLQSR